MEDKFINGMWMKAQSAKLLSWVNENILTWDMATQICLMLVLCVAAYVLAGKSSVWLKQKISKNTRKSIIHIYASYREIFFLVYYVLFLWVAVLVAENLETPASFLRIVASLATAWAVIRFTSSTIESPFWSRLIALTLWTLAALNIVGWLGPAVTLLGKTGFAVGDYRFSLLLVVKSVMALGVLLWAVGFLSGVMERSFSKAQRLTPSQRVLFNKLSTIALYVIAALIGMNIVGIDLTALTVFSGALGLGIGFGLQKVFGNLISGIILLMDKSVKPGDVIAVGETFGWVNSLGARCVSVLTRDGKEHLIPNENLITQEVENWSYSDRKVRIHIPIGVSYASDVHQVKALLLQAVAEHPRILKMPAPTCLIKGFGDSSIDYEIRAWIDDPAGGVSNIKSDVYYRVWDMFKENGIEIPFPQRDISLKPETLETLAVLLAAAKARA